MSRRSTRADAGVDLPRLLQALATCRAALVDASARAKPGGPLYNGLGMCTAAIDGLATYVTGNPYYFYPQGHSTLAGPRRHRDGGSQDEG